MDIEEIMTKSPAFCTSGTSLKEVAQLMKEYNCGEIPVIENEESLKPIGTVTDRDITIRMVAEGKNPLNFTARDCMSAPCITVDQDTSIEQASRVMENHQIRRLPVVDLEGKLCGILTQADLARHLSREKTGEVVSEISKPSKVGI